MLNPDKELVDMVLSGLASNELRYGQRYCPCLVKHSDDSICPCLDYRTIKLCHCGLYVQ